MTYEKPAIIRRDLIAGLLRPPKTDTQPDAGDTNISDVNRKEHIRSVVWGSENSERVPYAMPSIIKRVEIKAYLDAVKTDVTTDAIPSDANIKDNIVPVRW